MNPVTNGKKVDLCSNVAIEGEIVRVHEHLKTKLIQMAK
jgi:hypothetical protein